MSEISKAAVEAAKQINFHLLARRNHTWSVDSFEKLIQSAIDTETSELKKRIRELEAQSEQ